MNGLRRSSKVGRTNGTIARIIGKLSIYMEKEIIKEEALQEILQATPHFIEISSQKDFQGL